MKLLKLINPENASEEEVSTYPVREASRAVVVDEDGHVALLHATRENYFKLPGGGIEAGEDKMRALKRECQEEIGCDITIVGEIGSTIEYRKTLHLKQIPYCYFAKVKGKKGTPNPDEGEKAAGFVPVWLPYDDALRSIGEDEVPDLEKSKYILPRDYALLKAARDYIADFSSQMGVS
ncbi:MAG: NUDIX domain-containing protein [Candidatus Pacebacteria bacterium]|jgi:8-oxo-dGTP pyrophosphatase MutT (NUDIX family)|nr:NUDIX domain-containing protein [Candidatus Paceibacterota bacterium]